MTSSQTVTADTAGYETLSEGVEIRLLRAHGNGGLTFFIRMKKGARAPRHGHPGGEETCLLQGVLRIEKRVAENGEAQPDIVVSEGEYAFVPAGELHEGVALEDSLFLVVAPGGVVREPRGEPRG
ncbi:MAG: cupin domain-containing protein [Polyangiaceae bacterium]|nr:cupin domain-containing protein [Polyangiaceae bacterium]